MASKFRTFTRKLLITMNILLAILYLLACVAPYLNPAKWWFISWLGLIFPFLFFLLVLSIFFWLVFKRAYAIVLIAIILLGWKNISVFFAFHIQRRFNYEKEPGSLRIVTWNVARFIEIRKNNNVGSRVRMKMMNLLKQQDADILCLQEFHTAAKDDYYDNIAYIRKQLNYPYYYFSFDEDGSKLYYSSIIFSRLPMFDTGIVIYPKPSLPEALLHADIKLNDDTIRIFTSHLQSVQFHKRDYQRINDIRNYEDSLVSNSRTIFDKVRKSITNRSLQVGVIRQQLKQSPYPVIFCGDFNDVPNSYTYFSIRGNMLDAFLEKGGGIGRTFSALSPTLRIDYILASKEFSILQFNRVEKIYSDHYMLVTDVKLKPPSPKEAF